MEIFTVLIWFHFNLDVELFQRVYPSIVVSYTKRWDNTSFTDFRTSSRCVQPVARRSAKHHLCRSSSCWGLKL